MGWRYRGPFDDLAPGARGRAPRDPVGRGHDGPGHRARPHRAGLRRRGLRALEGARPAGADAGRRVGPLLRRLRLAARALDDRGRRPDHRPARRDGLPRRGRALHARVPALLALRHAADLPALRRLVHRRRRDQAEAARGEREGRVGARVHGQAHGRLAAQHGRLEHLAPPLLRPAAAALPVRVRTPERDRLEGRARPSGRSRASSSSRSSAARGSTACRSAARRAARP